MAQFIADRRDIDFVLHEQLEVGNLSSNEKFAEYSKKTIDMVVSEARNLAVKEVLPTNAPGDLQGCKLENGEVIIPEDFKKIWEHYKEGEWIAMSEDPEWGGQGMPHALSSAATEYLNGANMAMFMYVALTHGAAGLVETFGTDKQKNLYVKKMYSGEWSGTMLLTEPSAGSDVGALETIAKKNDDGTYSISGNKIFISGGEHDLAENIVHPVLARIEGAPEGTKGISLFLVPKYRVDDDGSLGEFNDVICTGIEHKMGIHGNCTCSLTLGGKDNCVGTLLGEENKGMKAMFIMMNGARLYVGQQGLSLASSSYINAVNYAKERVQGPNLLTMLEKNPPAVPIVQHPDIRRTLMSMKSYVEGMRSLVYYVGNCFDLQKISNNSEEIEKLQGLIDVLIPIAKGYVTDKAFEVCSHGMQVYGGYGFIEEYPQAQLLRDCKITQIYEGTNGIQALDLVGRKMVLHTGKYLRHFFQPLSAFIEQHKNNKDCSNYMLPLAKSFSRLQTATMIIAERAQANPNEAAVAATEYLKLFGLVAVAYMWAQMALQAQQKQGHMKAEFYDAKIKTATFYMQRLLPQTGSLLSAIMSGAENTMGMTDDQF